MKQENDDQTQSDSISNRIISGRRKVRFLILGSIIVFLVILLISWLGDRLIHQGLDADQQISNIVSTAVAQTQTHQAVFTALTKTALLADLSSTENAGLLSTFSPTGQSTESGALSALATAAMATKAVKEELCPPIEGVAISELNSIISQAYNVPNQSSDLGHHGVDLGSYNFHGAYLFEVPVRAILAGRVAGITINRPPIGNVIILETKFADLPVFLREFLEIEPDQSLYHFYGHLVNEPEMPVGTQVVCGEQINLLGKSRTVEAHLHLEIRIGKSQQIISGMAFYDTATTEEERAEYLWWRTSGEMKPVDPMIIFQEYLEQ